MKFYQVLNGLLKENEVDIYFDIDGVLAEYDIGNFDYKTIRPIKTTIKVLENLFKTKNVNIYLLSICKTDTILKDKNTWLETNIPFVSKENIILISKEATENKEKDSKELKSSYLKRASLNNKKIIMIDDDNEIIKFLRKNNPEIIIFQDSSIVE